jgi:hypothetical protein
VTFEKDFLDLRAVSDEEKQEPEDRIPKGLTAPESVGTLLSTTGLEDVSPEDLDSNAQTSAAKEMNPVQIPASGQPLF